jgi:hypothetical protein
MIGRALDLCSDLERGRLVITKIEPGRWVVTWLPHRKDDPNYPGFTLDSTQIPRDALKDEEEGILGWALTQGWASPYPVAALPQAFQLSFTLL